MKYFCKIYGCKYIKDNTFFKYAINPNQNLFKMLR